IGDDGVFESQESRREEHKIALRRMYDKVLYINDNSSAFSSAGVTGNRRVLNSQTAVERKNGPAFVLTVVRGAAASCASDYEIRSECAVLNCDAAEMAKDRAAECCSPSAMAPVALARKFS